MIHIIFISIECLSFYCVVFTIVLLVQLIAQKGDINQALELVSAARHKEGKEYVLPSSELTYELINRIKQRQIKAGKISNSEQKMKDEADALRKMKENLAKIKMGDFS